MKPNLTLSYWLSSALVIVTLIGSIGSLVIPNIFRRDHPVFAGNAQGTLLVILVVTLPILVVAMFLTACGSARGQIAWIVAPAQIFYNAVYLTFDTNFNQLFFVYVAMLSLGFWSLVVLLRQIDVDGLKNHISAKMPVRILALFLLFPALAFSAQAIGGNLTPLLAGTMPASIVGTQLPTNPFDVLNLAFLIPIYLLAAIWLWRRRTWGYLLTGPLLLLMCIESVSIATDQYFGSLADPRSTLASMDAIPGFVILALIYLIPIGLFFWNIQRDV